MPSATTPTLARATVQSKSIPPAAMPLISPAALLQAHLTQPTPTRPSNRSPDQTRQIDLNIGSLTHCNGSSVVKIGNTTIICGVRGEILPTTEIPSYTLKSRQNPALTSNSADTGSNRSPESQSATSLYNLLVPNLDLSTGCSPLHAPNTPPTTLTQSLTQRLYTLLHTTHLIPSSSLEILYTPPADIETGIDPDDPAYVEQKEEVKAYWTLYIDMVCISYGGEGSLFDCAWFAMLSALRDTILPKAWWDADEGIVLCSPAVRDGRRLEITGLPTPLSFGIFVQEDEQRHWVLLDQDSFEEESCDERGCIVVDGPGRIVRIEKNGGGVTDVQIMKELLKAATRRYEEWDGVLGRALAASRS